MKIDLEELIRSVSHESVPVSELAPQRQERIRRMTMMKIENTEAGKKRRRPAVAVVAVAAVVAMLSVTAFAAYESGWFGRIFGEKAGLVEEHVVSHQEIATPETPFTDLAPEEQEKVAAGDPESPYVGTTVTTLEDYRFTLESTLAGRNTIYEIIRMEPISDHGKENMGLETPNEIEFYVVNQTSEGGSVDSKLLSNDGETAYYLAIYNGNGANQAGDLVTTEVWLRVEDMGAPLFTAQLDDVMEDQITISLDTSAYDTSLQYQDTLTITPMSMTIEGWFDFSYADQITEELLSDGKTKADVDIRMYEPQRPKVTITLKDGTSFRLKDGTFDTEFSEYGTYGTLLASGQGDPETPGRSLRLSISVKSTTSP